MNRKITGITLLLCSLGGANAMAAGAPANIVYPINGGIYRNYFTASFGTTCAGGQYKSEWGFDNTTIGHGYYYDQESVQFSYKLPTGWHTFWVRTSCGSDIVKFQVL